MARQILILPEVLINEIMSYGDPIINQRHEYVIRQISYNYEEFKYLRTRPHNFYGGFRECDFRYFILNRSLNKIETNCNTKKRRERKSPELIRIILNGFRLQNNHGIMYPMPEEEANFAFPLGNTEANLLYLKN